MPDYPRPDHVIPIPLAQVAAAADAAVADAAVAAAAAAAAPAHPLEAGEVMITGVTHDSGQVRPGDLYAALRGTRRHGASFAADAVSRGAVAVLTDAAGARLIGGRLSDSAGRAVPVLVAGDPRARLGDVAAEIYGHPSRSMTVIGITGTAGKTSAAYLIEAGLAQAGHVTGMIGTVETRIAGQVIDSERTTPEATDLHALLAVARERGATAAVMEVSSHALAYGRVGGVSFDVGAFTGFGLDHLDFHADVDDYFAAKAKLFDGRCRVEVLNLDDPAVRRLVRPGSVTFSAAGNRNASWWADKITADGRAERDAVGPAAGAAGYGQKLLAVGPDGVQVPLRVALPGRHNVANALLALACLVAAGVDPDTAAAGIARCPGAPGRLERVNARGPVLGVVDYAHKPDAVVAVIAALRELLASGQSGRPTSAEPAGAGGRLICVIGAGGDRDPSKRALMGRAAASADAVVVTDDNPRTEDPAAIRAAVRAGAVEAAATTGAQVLEVAGRREAIAAAVALAQPGDIVAVLGKGHERGQEANGKVAPFDDREELAAALNAAAGTAAASAADAGTAAASAADAGTAAASAADAGTAAASAADAGPSDPDGGYL